MRLRRLSRDAIYKEEQQQVVVPLKRGADPALFLTAFLQQLVPPPPDPRACTLGRVAGIVRKTVSQR
jgi:hypothetical protein